MIGSLGLFRLVFYLSTPVALGKAAISGVHLITAARNLGAIDESERQAGKSAKNE